MVAHIAVAEVEGANFVDCALYHIILVHILVLAMVVVLHIGGMSILSRCVSRLLLNL